MAIIVPTMDLPRCCDGCPFLRHEYGWPDVFVSDHGEALANGLQTRSVYIVR